MSNIDSLYRQSTCDQLQEELRKLDPRIIIESDDTFIYVKADSGHAAYIPKKYNGYNVKFIECDLDKLADTKKSFGFDNLLNADIPIINWTFDNSATATTGGNITLISSTNSSSNNTVWWTSGGGGNISVTGSGGSGGSTIVDYQVDFSVGSVTKWGVDSVVSDV